MTGILDSLMNVKLCLKGGFQSSQNYKISNVTTPGRCSFKMMRLMDYCPKDGLPASNMNNAASKKNHSNMYGVVSILKPQIKQWKFATTEKQKLVISLYFGSTRIFAFSAPRYA